jgi:hypothetical protein
MSTFDGTLLTADAWAFTAGLWVTFCIRIRYSPPYAGRGPNNLRVLVEPQHTACNDTAKRCANGELNYGAHGTFNDEVERREVAPSQNEADLS